MNTWCGVNMWCNLDLPNNLTSPPITKSSGVYMSTAGALAVLSSEDVPLGASLGFTEGFEVGET